MPRIIKRKYAFAPSRTTRVRKAAAAKTTTRRTRRTRTRRAPAVSAGGRPDGIQRFNQRGSRSFTVNRTAVLGNINTLASGQAFLYSPSSAATPFYSIYTGQFTKFRVNSIKMRFELTTFEQTDDSVMPTIYIRRNQDPDKTTLGMTGTTMMLETGTIKKTFTAGSNVLEISFRPMVMVAGLQTAGGSYMPMPRRMGFIDSTQDITMYGLQYFVSAAGLNQTLIQTVEWSTTWAGPK